MSEAIRAAQRQKSENLLASGDLMAELLRISAPTRSQPGFQNSMTDDASNIAIQDADAARPEFDVGSVQNPF